MRMRVVFMGLLLRFVFLSVLRSFRITIDLARVAHWESSRKSSDDLLHRFVDLPRVARRSTDDRFANAAKDELLRACVHKIKNQCALGVLVHIRVSARRTRPHAVVAVSIRPCAAMAVAPVGV